MTLKFVSAVACAGTIVSLMACNVVEKTNERPNVIIVLTDDQGFGDFSIHGHPVLETPVLDQLHGASIRFSDFHVAPMCTPTRGQLLSGRDAMANGATAVCLGRSMIREELPTMADFFKQSGYHTAHFGKWHLGDSYPYRPQDRGFDETVHHGAWGIGSIADYYTNSYWDDKYLHNEDLKQYKGYCTDVWFDLSVDYIRRMEKSDQPFFLYLATNSPHAPHLVDDEYAEPYLQKGMNPVTAKYFGQIANIDYNMQHLLDVLDETGVGDNTILLFMTDNGTLPRGFQVYNAGMRGNKTDPYEGGHRAALFVSGPEDMIGAPRDIDELTQVQDVLPTLIELCGLKNPDDTEFDGVSLMPLLKGETDELEDRILVVEYENPYRPAENKAVIWKQWRLVKHTELYDLSVDPGQLHDVSSKYPDVMKKLQDYYNDWREKTLPLYNKPRYIRIGTEKQNPLVLYSSDWQGSYADNKGNLFAGDRVGRWQVFVETPGKYKVTLSRWHPASGLPLAAPMIQNDEERGAIPVAQAKLKVGEFEKTVKTMDKQARVEFTVDISAGENFIETFLLDKEGSVLCSAYYTEVELIR